MRQDPHVRHITSLLMVIVVPYMYLCAERSPKMQDLSGDDGRTKFDRRRAARGHINIAIHPATAANMTSQPC